MQKLQNQVCCELGRALDLLQNPVWGHVRGVLEQVRGWMVMDAPTATIEAAYTLVADKAAEVAAYGRSDIADILDGACGMFDKLLYN